jgi:hypothetical protein
LRSVISAVRSVAGAPAATDEGWIWKMPAPDMEFGRFIRPFNGLDKRAEL